LREECKLGFGGHQIEAHPAHNACPIEPVHGTLAGVANTRDIGLAAKKDWVDKRLGFVEVREKKDRGRYKAKEDGEVVSDERV